MPPSLFTLVILEIVSLFAQAVLDFDPPILKASCCYWDDRYMAPHPADG
jgi:hypothetical protein